MRSAFREIAETVLLAVLVYLALQTSIQNFRVEGTSMMPTLQDGQYILVNKLVYWRLDLEKIDPFVPFLDLKGVFTPFGDPKRGDIVVFHPPGNSRQDFIKRVVAVPGDTVEIRNGKVYVNGKALKEPYIAAPSHSSMAPITLGEGEFFVLGDNRPRSNDSRSWGPVPRDRIIGKAWLTYWPPSRLGLLPTYAYED